MLVSVDVRSSSTTQRRRYHCRSEWRPASRAAGRTEARSAVSERAVRMSRYAPNRCTRKTHLVRIVARRTAIRRGTTKIGLRRLICMCIVGIEIHSTLVHCYTSRLEDVPRTTGHCSTRAAAVHAFVFKAIVTTCKYKDMQARRYVKTYTTHLVTVLLTGTSTYIMCESSLTTRIVRRVVVVLTSD